MSSATRLHSARLSSTKSPRFCPFLDQTEVRWTVRTPLVWPFNSTDSLWLKEYQLLITLVCKGCTVALVFLDMDREVICRGWVCLDRRAKHQQCQNHLFIWRQEWLKWWIQSIFIPFKPSAPILYPLHKTWNVLQRMHTIFPPWIKHLSFISRYNMCRFNGA